MLKHLGLKPGQTLVILGAAGSVGTIAVQLARSHGLTVVGVAGQGPGASRRSRGPGGAVGDGWAARIRIAAPTAVDAVFDTTGAGLLGDAVALTTDPSKVITIADHHAAEHGVRFTGADPADRAPEALPELAALAAKGELHVPIWRTYPLGDAAKAHDDLEAGRNRGKIILLPLLPVEPHRLSQMSSEALGGGPQRGRGGAGERVAVAEAGDGHVEARQPSERGGGLGAVDVEHAADHRSVRGPRGRVAGEQHLVPGKVDRDAAGRMAGDGDRHGAVAEAEFVAVAELAVDAGRCRRFGRDRVRS